MRKIYDAIIIGSGAAGYGIADCLFKKGITDIAVITENRFSGTSRNTGSDKQTYYKLSMDGFSQDSPYLMAKDICSLGCCDGIKAYNQAVNSAKSFLRLCDYGVNFPKDEFGGYPGYKTDHDNTSRATSIGPLTSRVMTEKLEKAVIENNRTPLLDNRQVVKIITGKNGVSGVIVLNKESGKPEVIGAKNVIAASGAPACIYENSVYPHSQHGMTGIIIDAGASLCNFSQWQYGMSSVDFRWNVSGSFMQVIPRFVSVDDNGIEREFLREHFENDAQLCSTVFLKGYQWPFSYDRIEASSKVDIAVHEETLKGRKVYLDFTKNPEGFDFENLSDEARDYLEAADANGKTPIERLEKLNPKAIDIYASNGIDIAKDMLRIAVCAQHNNGGIHTDKNYMTAINGLYVIGEASGSFGLTRPGGSALNDTQTSGFVCAEHIAVSAKNSVCEADIAAAEKEAADFAAKFTADESVDYSDIPREMSACASFIRDYEKCVALLDKINALIISYPASHKSLSDYYYDYDMLVSAKALLEAITAEMPLAGSRGGAMMVKDGKIIAENKDYRKYLTVSQNGEIRFVPVSPIPTVDRPFEFYLNRI